jgi:hypothetical protein
LSVTAPTLADVLLREAAVELQHRYAWGIDGRDWALFRSVFSERVLIDFTAWHGGAPQELAADDWVERVRARQSGFDATQHRMSNHRVRSTGKGEAECVTYIVARHRLRIDGVDHIQALGGHYTNRLVERDGGWRIAASRLTVWWEQGDRGVFDLAARRWSERISEAAAPAPHRPA